MLYSSEGVQVGMILSASDIRLLTDLERTGQACVTTDGKREWNSAIKLYKLGIVDLEMSRVQRDLKRGSFGRLQHGVYHTWVDAGVTLLAGRVAAKETR